MAELVIHSRRIGLLVFDLAELAFQIGGERHVLELG